MESSSCVLHPILGALLTLEKLIGGPRQWFGINELQRRLLRYSGSHLEVSRRELDLLRQIEGVTLKTKAATDAETLRQFLADEDFNLHVKDFKPDEVGAAAVLRILVQWLMTGKPCQIASIRTGDQLYPAFRIMGDHKVGNISFFGAADHPHDVVKLVTRSGIDVYITRLDEGLEDLDLLDRVMRLRGGLSSKGGYDGVIVPMVNMDHEVDIAWLKGMKTLGWFVAQALQQTKLRMNHVGALAESAAVVTSRKSPAKEPECLTIDGPFLMWMWANGFSIPLFTARITEADWEDPGPIPGLEGDESGLHVSRDGGRTWKVPRVRIPTIRKAN